MQDKRPAGLPLSVNALLLFFWCCPRRKKDASCWLVRLPIRVVSTRLTSCGLFLACRQLEEIGQRQGHLNLLPPGGKNRGRKMTGEVFSGHGTVVQ